MIKRITFFAVIFIFLIITGTKAVTSLDSLNLPPFGKVYIYKNSPKPVNVIIMISGDSGWRYGVVDFARTFSEMNNLVIGVDILWYYKDLRKRTEPCYSVVPDFVQLATEIEKRYNLPDYRPPVLMGYSSGATLVYGILAQARPGTFAGGISLGFCPEVDLPKLLCQTNGLTEKPGTPGKSYYLQPDAKLGNHWIVLNGQIDKICNYEEVADFVKKTSDAELITLPHVGHDFSKWSDFMPQWKDAFIKLTNMPGQDKVAVINIDNLKDIPVVITNALPQKTDKPLALVISGDGGWYSFEQKIANNLAEMGIPALGLDSKRYFWTRKTPEQTADDISKVISYYMKVWGKEKFMLVGYSLGAEIVPFIVNRLPQELRSNIVSAVLLSPETYTDFEIHISNMIGMGNRQNTYNVTDEIIKMQPVHTLIIYGDGEKTKVPDLLKGVSVKITKIPGDHHYKFDLPLIMQTMKNNKAL